MTKKTFFLLLLFLMALGTVMNAQVTIGSDQNPKDGAVLDLSQVNDQNLGFLLPRVSLVNVTDWQLQGDSNNGAGMLVYNTNAATAGGNGKAGVYIWTGAGGWEALKSNFADAVPVEGFDLSPSSPVDLCVGQTATVTVSDFRPYNARYPGVYWKISEGQDKTRITTGSMTSCILTGLELGWSTLIVTSLDGNYQQTVTIDVKACSPEPVDCSGYFLAGGAYSGPTDLPLDGYTMADLTNFVGFQASGGLCIAKNDMNNGQFYYNSWQDAIDACESLNTGGQSEWRLPNVAELGNLTSHVAEYGLEPQYASINKDVGNDNTFYLWNFTLNKVTTASTGYYSAAVRCVKSL
ncbi:MAG: DUF1566 domain-containing protein [Dysgonamonadaceae bacterium]|jgi:hypothetical protein|nr:DUF1566 domain-containing protein [Dysgonamonadaceae bacterium]